MNKNVLLFMKRTDTKYISDIRLRDRSENIAELLSYKEDSFSVSSILLLTVLVDLKKEATVFEKLTSGLIGKPSIRYFWQSI